MNFPIGSFPQKDQSLVINVNFSHVNFRRFSITLTLAQKLVGVGSVVLEAIEALEFSDIKKNLAKAKKLFEFHTKHNDHTV